ncbi:hypothetical protein, partial [Streptomyces sindenensis]|uniref:hypothetical protein n=1 Tax=Streptomyces sindenensis TaxID=67363 RepID=UPI001E376F9F
MSTQPTHKRNRPTRRRHDIRDKLLRTDRILTHDHSGLPDLGNLPQHRLDLTQLDPVTTELDLMIRPPQKLQLPIHPPPRDVPRPVHPPTSTTERISHKPLRSQRRTTQ